MPRIELSRRQVSEPFVPRKEIPEGTGQEPYQALAQFGNQIQKTAQTVQSVDEALAKAQDAHDRAMLHAEMLKSDAELADVFNNDSDYTNYPDKLAKFQDAKKQQMMGLIHNPKLLEELGPTIDAHQIKQTVTIRDHGRQMQKADIQNNYLSNVVPQFEKSISDAPDAETRASLQEQFSQLTDEYIRTGILSAGQGIQAKKNVTIGVDLTRAEQDATIRPSEFLKKSDEQRRIDYPFLSNDQFRKLDLKAFKEKKNQLIERDYEEKQYREEKSYEALNILSGKGSISQKVAGIKALANPDPKTGFRGIDAWKAAQIIEHLEKGDGSSGGSGGDSVAYIYAMGAAREGMLSKQDLLKYMPLLSPKQFAMVDVTNNTAVRKEKDADFKALKSQVSYMESTYANDLQGMFPQEKGLRNLLEADFRETASTYLNADKIDNDALGKLNRRRMNMIDWVKSTGVKSATKQLEKITRTGIYPTVTQGTQQPPKDLPKGWSYKNGKVYDEKGIPKKWVE
jgi:hypothetical protein